MASVLRMIRDSPDELGTPTPPTTTTLVPPVTSNVTDAINATVTTTTEGTFYGKIVENKDMLMRTFYVLLAVTSIVIIYFVVKAWRTRRRQSKTRRYGLISSGADMEMEPLDADDDDDDDMTVFERRK